MSLERSIKLSCAGSGSFEEARESLVAFLQEFQSLHVREKVVLNIDVCEMPLLMDVAQLRELIGVLAGYEDCFKKVAMLKITPARGVQEMIVRGTVAILPFSVPVEVHTKCEDSERLPE
jgi:hypothetical protein